MTTRLLEALVVLAALALTSCGEPTPVASRMPKEDAAFVILSADTLNSYDRIRVLRHAPSGACFVAYTGSHGGVSIISAPAEVCQERP